MFRECGSFTTALRNDVRYAIELCFCMTHSVGGDCCEQVIIPLVILFYAVWSGVHADDEQTENECAILCIYNRVRCQPNTVAVTR